MKRIYTASLGIVVVGIFVLLKLFGVGQSLEAKGLDVFQTSHHPHPDLVIVAVDNKSIEAIGRWPWDRSVFAGLVDRFSSSGVRAAGFDVTFSETQKFDNDQKFKRALDNAPFPVVLATRAVFDSDTQAPASFQKPLSYFYEKPKDQLGLVNVQEDADGLSRQFPKALSVGGETLPPFSFALARAAGASIPTKPHLIDFSGPAGAIPTYSISDVLSGSVSPETLKDKIVLVGATASDLHDYILAPVTSQTMAGVEWHANVLDNILQNRGLVPVSQKTQLLIWGLVGLVLLSAFVFAPTRIGLVIAVVVLLALPVISFVLWHLQIAFPYVLAAIMVFVLFVTQSLYRWYLTEKDRRMIRRTMQHYFSPQVLQHVLQHPEELRLGGQRKLVTVFFSDIRSFTTITESCPPEVLSKILHEYFTEMTEEVLKTDGVVDKFIGDAIMAFWGAPIAQEDQADRALTAALAMLEKLPSLRQRWKQKGWPEINIGIGIHTGQATVGNMGSDKRFDYTVIGDCVNAASRLEGLTKEYKVPIVISQTTKDLLKGDYHFTHLGSSLVKGKTEPIEVFTVDKTSKNS